MINKVKNLIKLLSILAFISLAATNANSAETAKLLKTDWSFKGLFGKFDRGALQEDIKFTQRYVPHAIP